MKLNMETTAIALVIIAMAEVIPLHAISPTEQLERCSGHVQPCMLRGVSPNIRKIVCVCMT